MATLLTLEDHFSLSDLQHFLERANQISDGTARFTAHDNTLRVTVCAFQPFGLLDTSPTVLGMRVFKEGSGIDIDALLSLRAMLDRIAHAPNGTSELGIPPMRETAVWVGIEPPKGNWQHLKDIDAEELADIALRGISEIAEALPDQPGELVVREVREKVWGAEIEGFPKSVAFTAHMLGFLRKGEPVRMLQSGRWLRFSTSAGHVLVYLRDR